MCFVFWFGLFSGYLLTCSVGVLLFAVCVSGVGLVFMVCRLVFRLCFGLSCFVNYCLVVLGVLIVSVVCELR